ncbi:response regulator [Paenibacillus sp. KQZ6P-2]|uniref:Response regulator n=1 Tax=Paenibacillus mangrovi TaxID=2931978 RepID=A0A9X1WMP7_9BACL|nr:response regulator [Paenibacillus mangrovi]MCJ8012087.1 response regulator [Paenibacillus mangrovi]
MRVLIVEDEPVIQKGLVKMVQRYPASFSAIYTADDGETALEMIRSEEPHLVLTDLRMKRMDGLDLCERIHREFGHVQVAVISGYNDFEYAQRAIAYGVKRYLLKPVTQQDVHDALREIIAGMNENILSLQKYVEWAEKLEQSIWMLQKGDMTRLLEESRENCLFGGLHVLCMKSVLEDCLNMIVGRLSQRGWQPQISVDKSGTDISKKEALEAFGIVLEDIYTQLQLTRKGKFKDPIEEAKAFIDLHLSEEVTLEEVAKKVGLTRTYFSALFKKMTGETFVHYRIKKRIEEARKLLAIPALTITDIAVQVGYEDYPHFTKTFKNFVGMSPSEYRSFFGIE